MSDTSTRVAFDEDVPAATLSAAGLTITGSAPAVVREGARFLVELRVRNDGPGSRAVNVYVRCSGTPIVRLHCGGAKTSRGRFHGSAVLCLPSGAEAKLVALVGPVEPGVVVVRADAVSDDASVGTVVTTTATRRTEADA